MACVDDPAHRRARRTRRATCTASSAATAGTATFGTAVSTTFGGRVGLGLTRHIQIVGEGGRLAGFKSAPFDLLGLFTATVRVSAFYGEGGMRFIAVPRPAVRPYAEVTAGVTRLNASLSGPAAGR